LVVGVFFGGPSVEHDVSIISALQLMEALEPNHQPLPLYLARDGRLYTGESLRQIDAFRAGKYETSVELRLGSSDAPLVIPSDSRFRSDQALPIDCAICAVHGTGGEDGSLLGALDLAGIPYAGGNVGSAAAAMNKATAKAVFSQAGIPVSSGITLMRHQFHKDPDHCVSDAVDKVGVPCFIKPVSLGSSIGVSRCSELSEIREALELCFELDRVALIEPAHEGYIDIN
jgi:D-alanine-D-alanine ligase